MFAVADPLDLISGGVEKLAAEDRSGWSAAAQGDLLAALLAARERLDALVLAVAGQWDAAGGWAEDGYASASAWLAHHAPVARAAACRLVRTSRHVQGFEATADALGDGVVTAGAVEVLAESAKHREVSYQRDEHVLLDAAARLSIHDLAVATKSWRNLADDELARVDAAAAFDRRHLHVSNTLLSGVLAGFLDPEATATLTRALDSIAPPDAVDGPEPPRSLSQRRADGLVDLAAFYLEHRSDHQGGRSSATIDAIYTVRAETLPLEQQRCELVDFGPIPRSTMERLLCDCALGGIVMNGPSEVIDVGRRRRLPNRAQCRAVRARDRHCQHPGCRVPAAWCDVHHLVPWEQGGPTDLWNLALLCRRHHVAVHEGGKKLIRGPAGVPRLE
jgi:hypothetical protein